MSYHVFCSYPTHPKLPLESSQAHLYLASSSQLCAPAYMCGHMHVWPMSSSWCFPYTSRCESIELGWSVRSHTLRENWLVLYQKLPTVHSSSIWGGAHELPLFHDNMLTGWTCASFVQVNTGSWVHWSCPVEKTLFPSILHDHFQSFLPLFHDGPWG